MNVKLKYHHKLIFWGTLAAILLFNSPSLFTATPQQAPVVISEFMAANSHTYADEDGNYVDWVEVHNRSKQMVNLADWTLSDDADQPDKWTLPPLDIEPGAYLLIFASGKDEGLHTNFKLNAEGGHLALYAPTSRRFKDVVPITYPALSRDISFGLRTVWVDDYVYFSQPTPGTHNDLSAAYVGKTEAVQANVARGLHTAPFTLTLVSPSPQVQIFYTLDGSEPHLETANLYTKPLTITETTVVRAVAKAPDLLPSASTAFTYIFLSTVLSQPALPFGYPETWGTHSRDIHFKATDTDFIAGTPALADYEMDPEIVHDPAYHDLLRQGLQALPSISIALDKAEFLTLYSQPMERGRAWERPISLEWFDPQAANDGFQVNAGLRIQGKSGRLEYMPKHSFRLFFRGDYGPPKLAYPLFPDGPVAEFDTLVLRAGANRSFAGNKDSKPRRAAYVRDEWLRRTQLAVSGYGPRGRFVHLYINGLYWGLYNLVERPDAQFAADYFGGEVTDWHDHKHDGPISGNSERVFTLAEKMLEWEVGGFTVPENYQFAQQYLDIEDFIDYVILNWYAGNQDWPVSNWYAAVRNPDGLIRFFTWDGEHTWTEGALLYLELFDPSNLIGRLFMALMYNPDFRLHFADRVYALLYNDGPLTEENAQARWKRLIDEIDPAIVAESARWGDVRYEKPVTRDRWLKEQAKALALMEVNVDKMIGLLRDQNYYPPFHPPTFSQHGGAVRAGYPITLQSETPGQIYYTLDGSDPRQANTGLVAPSAQMYSQTISITQTSQLKARLWVDDVWSALAQARFQVASSQPKLIISEVMYNPLGEDETEFIELYNAGNTLFDVSNYSFEGVDFTFPANTHLEIGQYMLVGRNMGAFTARYPGVSLDGEYQGKLSNKGERLILLNDKGEAVITIPYDDENGWPLSADGVGDSLELIKPQANPADPINWQASPHVGGSPGR